VVVEESAELLGGKFEGQIWLSAPEAEIYNRRKRDLFLGCLKSFGKALQRCKRDKH
jgi:hypothetical protein